MKTDTKPTITFVAALSCELKGLLDLYRPKKQFDKPFGYFSVESEYAQIEMLVTGIGALSMATAIGWLAAFRPQMQRAWLNVGTAGHASRALGEAFRVVACADILAERKHFPPLVAKCELAGDEVLSVNAPTSDYPAEGGMDMEAFAFFTSATRFSSNELAQSIKVVSDNPEHGLENLNADRISALMQPHTQLISNYGVAMAGLAKPVVINSELSIPSDMRFTHSQGQQFATLVKKLSTLDAINDDLRAQIAGSNDIKTVMALLQSRLNGCVPVI